MVIQITLPIPYAKCLPARQDGAIILPVSQHMNHHLPAGRFVPADRFEVTNSIL